MQTYTSLNQKNITETLKVIDELNQKFPLMTIEDIDFSVLAKEVNISKQHFLSMIVFMDWFNAQGNHVNIYDINSLKVKKSKNNWQFLIKSKVYKDILKFTHTFSFNV